MVPELPPRIGSGLREIEPLEVHEHAHHLEERRHALDFIDDHETAQPAEGLFRCREALAADGGFQIEVGAPGRFRGDLPGKRGLSALARAGEGSAGMHGEGLADRLGGVRPVDQHAVH